MSTPIKPVSTTTKYVPPHYKAQSHDARKTPLVSSGVFQRSELPSPIVDSYRAAGILPYVVRRRNNADGTTSRVVIFLLGKQPTKSQDRRWRTRWVEFGGKVEDKDASSPETTARRELSEETSACLGEVKLHPTCIWNAMCKYVLFFGEITQPLPETLPKNNDEINEYRFVERDQMEQALRVGTLADAELSYRTRSSLSFLKAWQLIRSL